MRNRLVYGTALLASLATISPVLGKECAPLKMLASAKLELKLGDRPMIPVIVNGSPTQFLLDTGGIYTEIAPKVVKALKLKTELDATPLYDVSGNVSTGYVKLDTFSLGGMTGKDVYLRVAPSNLETDGLIAPDVLKRYDVEMDFSGGKMNYFLSDHCPGKVIYWHHGDVSQVSIVLADKRYIKVPAKLDGQSLMAIIDTGATHTTISTKTASDIFGLTPSSPGMAPAGNVNGDSNLASYLHTFSNLTLDGITIKNPHIVIMPDLVSDIQLPQVLTNNFIHPTQRAGLPELILGMDVLKHLHLYFAFDEHNLYVTAAEGPPKTTNSVTVDPPKLSSGVIAALREAQNALKAKDYSAALAAVTKAKAVTELQPFDMYMINRIATSVHASMNNLAAADFYAEAAADVDPTVIPDMDKASVYRAALQLALHSKHYDKAARYARSYQATNPSLVDEQLIRAALSHDASTDAATPQ